MSSLSMNNDVVLALVKDEEVRARSRGTITKNPVAPDVIAMGNTAENPRFRFETGGFYCEDIFGPFDSQDPDAFAHIELCEPIRHPWFDMHLQALPVLPATLRRFSYSDGILRHNDLTWHYHQLYGVNSSLARLAQLGAPAGVIETHRGYLERDLAILFDNYFAEDPLVWEGQLLAGSLASKLDTDAPDRLESFLFALGLQLRPA